ncbi:MAG: flagellar biosynthesis protein FlhB [Candidatus Marinimicrobia bacterium]|nr:flagellar biosynthesis protein FlhB [Candidatus Neomarinimicrobiota bacterium]
MAEQPAQDRTEEATPKHLQEARDKGDVVKSIELTSAVLLLSSVALFYFTGEAFLNGMADVLADVYRSLGSMDITPQNMPALTGWLAARSLTIMGPILLLVLVMALVVNYLQVGVIFATKALEPKWERVNPLSGLKRIFSTKGLVELIKGLLKLIFIGTIIYVYMSGRVKDYPFLTYMTPLQIIGSLATDLFKVGLYVGIAFMIMAIADFMYQRWEYKKKLRMSKQEIKEETKQTEGSPEMRARIKSMQREMSRNRMVRAVADATVVIVNPTHVAVALKYNDGGNNEAPLMVAKGQRKVAERIKQVAREHNVPIKESPPLARALYDSCESGNEIPYLYYKAVAEILAEIFWEEYGHT